MNDKTDENDDKFNEAVEYSTKIETIEEIRIVTDRPYFAKKLIPKLAKKIVEDNLIQKEGEVAAVLTTMQKPDVVKLSDESETDPSKQKVLFGIRGISRPDATDHGSEELESAEDPEPTPHPARPKIRPIITRKTPFVATRRPLVLKTQSRAPESEIVTEAPVDRQTTTGKKFVRRRYKKVDYKNGTIEKVYVGPSVEVDPAIRQAKLNSATTDAPDLPTPQIYGRTTKRGRLTPKRLIGRTTTSRSGTTEKKEEVNEVKKEQTNENVRRVYQRRPVVKSFEPTTAKFHLEKGDYEEDEQTTTRRTFQKRPVVNTSETTKTKVEDDETLLNQKAESANAKVEEDKVKVEEEEELEQTTRRRILLKRPVEKSFEATKSEVDDEETSEPTKSKVEDEESVNQRSEATKPKVEDEEVKVEVKEEVEQTTKRRILLKRPVESKLKVEDEESVLKEKVESTKPEHEDEESVNQKTESTKQKVEEEQDIVGGEEEVEQTTKRRIFFKRPVVKTFEPTKQEAEDEQAKVEGEEKRPLFEPTKQRKFIKRLKNIRERPTTTEASTDEASATEVSSTESSSKKIDVTESVEVPTTTISNKLEENLQVDKEVATLKDDEKVVKTNEESNEVSGNQSPTLLTKPGNRFDTASRAPFPARRRPNNERPSSRPIGQRFQTRPKLLLEDRPSSGDQEEEQEKEVQSARRPTSTSRRVTVQSGSRFQSRQKAPEIVEEVEEVGNSRRFKARNRFESKVVVKEENDVKEEAVEKAFEVKKTSGASNADLLKRRNGSSKVQPVIGFRYNGRKTTENDASVTEEELQNKTSTVSTETTAKDREETVEKVTETSETSSKEASQEVSSTVTEASSTTVKPSTEDQKSSTTTLKPTVKTTVKPVSTTLPPARPTFRTASTTLKPVTDSEKLGVRKEVQTSTTGTRGSTTTSTSDEEFFSLVKQKHKEVVEKVIPSLPGFKGRPVVTPTVPRVSSTVSTTLTTKKTTTATSKRPVPTTKAQETQTASPVVKFFIQDDSYYSLKPSRTFVPQAPYVSDAFRQIITDPPSRVVQQLPFEADTQANTGSEVNSASRFRVTAPTQPRVSLSTSGHRQTPSAFTSTNFAQGFGISQSSTNLPLSSIGDSQSSFSSASNRFQASFSSPTVPRPVQTISTTQFRTQAPQSRRPVAPAVTRQYFSNPDEPKLDLSPRSGPNRGRGGSRFNENELRWNKEIWTLEGEDQGFYNFIKY